MLTSDRLTASGPSDACLACATLLPAQHACDAEQPSTRALMRARSAEIMGEDARWGQVLAHRNLHGVRVACVGPIRIHMTLNNLGRGPSAADAASDDPQGLPPPSHAAAPQHVRAPLSRETLSDDYYTPPIWACRPSCAGEGFAETVGCRMFHYLTRIHRLPPQQRPIARKLAQLVGGDVDDLVPRGEH
jgi:hypothetical protein